MIGRSPRQEEDKARVPAVDGGGDLRYSGTTLGKDPMVDGRLFGDFAGHDGAECRGWISRGRCQVSAHG